MTVFSGYTDDSAVFVLDQGFNGHVSINSHVFGVISDIFLIYADIAVAAWCDGIMRTLPEGACSGTDFRFKFNAEGLHPMQCWKSIFS